MLVLRALLLIFLHVIEANECSAVMICAMHTLFNEWIPNAHRQPLDTRQTFYPNLNDPLRNSVNFSSRLQAVTVPYLNDISADALDRWEEGPTNNGSLSIQYGDFIDIYGLNGDRHRYPFDLVVTCFFIDTGKSILDYITTITKVLAPGGYWINTGPLHYHHPQVIPYSYSDVLEIIAMYGFDLVDSKETEMTYCGEDSVTMKPEVYHIPIAVFRYNRPNDWKRDNDDQWEREKKKEGVESSWSSVDYVVLK